MRRRASGRPVLGELELHAGPLDAQPHGGQRARGPRDRAGSAGVDSPESALGLVARQQRGAAARRRRRDPRRPPPRHSKITVRRYAVAEPAYSGLTQYDGITPSTSSTSNRQRGRALRSDRQPSSRTRCRSNAPPRARTGTGRVRRAVGADRHQAAQLPGCPRSAPPRRPEHRRSSRERSRPARLAHHAAEVLVHGGIVGQLGVKGGHQHRPCRAITASPPWRASVCTLSPTRRMRGARMNTISSGTGRAVERGRPAASRTTRAAGRRRCARRPTSMSPSEQLRGVRHLTRREDQPRAGPEDRACRRRGTSPAPARSPRPSISLSSVVLSPPGMIRPSSPSSCSGLRTSHGLGADARERRGVERRSRPAAPARRSASAASTSPASAAAPPRASCEISSPTMASPRSSLTFAQHVRDP